MVSAFRRDRLHVFVCVWAHALVTAQAFVSRSFFRDRKQLSSYALKVADIGSIKVMVVETRKEANMYLLGGLLQVDNIGAGHRWQGWGTKNCLSRDYVADIANKTPERLVVASDGSDVLYGGCDEATLRAKYDQIVSASSGNTVVVSAELGAWPDSVAETDPFYDGLQGRMEDIMNAAGLNSTVYTQFSTNDECGDCGNPRVYKYANGGFKIGPAKELAEVFDTLCRMYGDEQANLHKLVADGQHHLTLDYTGALVLSIHGMDRWRDILSIHNRSVHNSVTGLTQCFVHGNGNGTLPVKALAEELQAALRQ